MRNAGVDVTICLGLLILEIEKSPKSPLYFHCRLVNGVQQC
jgi:hypothetical protein